MRRLHHAHLMSRDLEAALRFYIDHFGGEVVADLNFAGARNVFMRVGGAALHFYDQEPTRRGPINHLGMCVDDLDRCVAELEAAGRHPRPIVDTGMGRYSMVEGPDGVLLEVFEPPPGLDAAMRAYFGVEDGVR
jgi:catechol 2,3-dioxygenase-like lactoylglutathione lyase family enzyme